MSREIHIPNFKSLSQSATEKKIGKPSGQTPSGLTDRWTDARTDRQTDGQTDRLAVGEETYSPPVSPVMGPMSFVCKHSVVYHFLNNFCRVYSLVLCAIIFKCRYWRSLMGYMHVYVQLGYPNLIRNHQTLRQL